MYAAKTPEVASRMPELQRMFQESLFPSEPLQSDDEVGENMRTGHLKTLKALCPSVETYSKPMSFHFQIGDKMSPAAVHVFRMAGHITRAIVEGEANDAANGQGPRIGKI